MAKRKSKVVFSVESLREEVFREVFQEKKARVLDLNYVDEMFPKMLSVVGASEKVWIFEVYLKLYT